LIVLLVIVVVVAGLVIFHGSPPKLTRCTTETCFNPKFSSCEPATFDYAVKSLGAIRYQIVGNNASTGGCDVTLWYTKKNSNHSWENKPMTCIFNNKVPIRQAASDVFSDLLSGHNTYDCTGPLVPIIQQAGNH
jgi:hypothetical protein